MADFFLIIPGDPRITPVHISLYMALLDLWAQKNCPSPMTVFSHEAMPLAKISGTATYYRTVRELNDYGYIRYIASYNHFRGSVVHLHKIEKL